MGNGGLESPSFFEREREKMGRASNEFWKLGETEMDMEMTNGKW